MVKSYYVISLLNYLGKICEKVAADILEDWCDVYNILYEGQMRL